MLYDYSIWRKMGSRGRPVLQDGGGGGAPPPPNQNTSQTPNQPPLNNYISHVQNGLNAYDWSTPPNTSINQTPFPSNLVTQILDNQINQGMIPHHRLMNPNEMLEAIGATANTRQRLANITFTPSETPAIPVTQSESSRNTDPTPADGRGYVTREQVASVLDNPTHYSRIPDTAQRREGHGYMPATQLGKDLKNPPTTQGPPPSN
jgi:hypothetical protein